MTATPSSPSIRTGWANSSASPPNAEENARRHQARHLRRTWRRPHVHRLLRKHRAGLRLLLALPRADRKIGRRAGRVGAGEGERGVSHPVISELCRASGTASGTQRKACCQRRHNKQFCRIPGSASPPREDRSTFRASRRGGEQSDQAIHPSERPGSTAGSARDCLAACASSQ